MEILLANILTIFFFLTKWFGFPIFILTFITNIYIFFKTKNLYKKTLFFRNEFEKEFINFHEFKKDFDLIKKDIHCLKNNYASFQLIPSLLDENKSLLNELNKMKGNK